MDEKKKQLKAIRITGWVMALMTIIYWCLVFTVKSDILIIGFSACGTLTLIGYTGSKIAYYKIKNKS